MNNSEQLIDLLLFTINKKATDASIRMNTDEESMKSFWKGHYYAFSEVYSMLTNIKNHLTSDSRDKVDFTMRF